jgi:hypothetical protein
MESAKKSGVADDRRLRSVWHGTFKTINSARGPQIGEEIAKQLQSVKHLLWHGNAEEAFERLGGLIIDLDLLRTFSHAADKLGQGIGEFETYIRNNIEFIPNFGER